MTSSTEFKPALTLTLAIALVAVAGSVVSSPASAGELYAGGSIGASHFDNKIDGVPGGNNGGAIGTIYGGYQFNKYFAVEAGLADLGHTESNQPLRATAHAGYADAVGFLPLTDKISLLGRAGVDRTKFHTDNGYGAGNGVKIGAGAEYALTESITLRSEVDRYEAHVFGDDVQVNQYLIGARVTF